MQPRALTIGNFDGVHVGHRAILQACRERAGGGGEVVVLTFDPPPVRVLRPEAEPLRLDTLQDRIRRLRAAGADRVEVLAPTKELLQQSAETFIGGLVERFGPSAFVEGPDFRFGRGRGGDHALLVRLGERAGFEAVRLERTTTVLPGGETVEVSSSLCRRLVGAGRVADAAACLGRPLDRVATVVRGEQRGRTIGFPTLNLDPADLAGCVVPAEGVYAASVGVTGGDRDLPAAVSIGTKPTFDGTALTVEAHLLDFSGELYGREVRVRFIRWLRGQQRYASVEELRAAVARDVAATRAALLAPALQPAP